MSAALATTRQTSLVDGEFALTAADFHALAEMLYAAAGIHLPESKAALVYSRLAKRLRALGLRSFREYVAFIQQPEAKDERTRLLMALTTNVTRFFREPHHFEHLIETVLEPRAAAVRGGAPLRLWSSACSTGQEAYSLALAVLSVLPDAPDLDVRILATDIDEGVVSTARAGAYTSEAVDQVPASFRKDWIVRDTDAARTWRVGAEARSLVSFNTLNLIGDWPMKRSFDAIFCRNVVIYFDKDTQRTLFERYANMLVPGGFLYIGHSENLFGITERFKLLGRNIHRKIA